MQVVFKTEQTGLVYTLQAQDKPEERLDVTQMYNLLTLAELRADTQVETDKQVSTVKSPHSSTSTE